MKNSFKCNLLFRCFHIFGQSDCCSLQLIAFFLGILMGCIYVDR